MHNEDFSKGDIVLTTGRRLTAQDVGVLAAVGCTAVPVFRRPLIGILSTGNELVPVTGSPKNATLWVNGRNILTAMVSPAYLDDFTIGFLFTEQIIKSIDEIESMKVDKSAVSVMTKNPFKIVGPKKIILSGCGGSSSFLDTKRLPQITSSFTVSIEMIAQAVKQVMDSDLHKLTGGVHVIGLMNRNGKVCIIEDIGRHNAFDKVIGFALRNQVDLSQSYVVSSGRISSEMVRKCLVANIPLIMGVFPPNVMPEEIDNDHPQRIRALIVSGSNPLRSYADTGAYEKAFAKLDLLVTIEVAMSETAVLSHYVLPAKSGYEKWDGTFFQWHYPDYYFDMRRPVVQPDGEQVEEATIFVELAQRLGMIPDYPSKLRELAKDRLSFGLA
jgi:FdhD protein